MSIKIDPCTACTNVFDNVNDINNCCYETLLAFYGKDSINDIERTKAADNCRLCISAKLRKMGPFIEGRSVCNMNIPPPPIFVQVPHLLPKMLLHDGIELENAKEKCIQLCDSNITKYPNECKKNCIIDYNSVVQEKKPITEVKEHYTFDDTFPKISMIIICILFITCILYYVML